MATGCVKIVKRAPEFDPATGKFIPEEKRVASVDLFKGNVAKTVVLFKSELISGIFGVFRNEKVDLLL